MMEITQALEAPCRVGSIVVTTTRVQRKGRPTWSIWRSHCSGVSVMSLSARFSVWLHVTDGRRFPILGIAHRDALFLIALLGYVPVEVPDARQVIQPSTELAAPCRGGMLHITHDLVACEGPSPWHTPRTAIAGVCAAIGPETATLLISMHSGQIVLVDGVAFDHALRAIMILGYLPASIPPLPEVVTQAAISPTRRHHGAGTASLPSPSRVRPRARVVPADHTRSAALRGGRLIPVLSPPEHPGAAAHGYAQSRQESVEDGGEASIAPRPVGASPARSFYSDEAASPHEPAAPWLARLTIDDIGDRDDLFRETEEAGGGLLRRLPEWLREPSWRRPEWLRLPAVPTLPVLHRPAWPHRQALRRAGVAQAAWALPVGPRELRPPDWQQLPDAPAHYERPGAWQRRSMPVRSLWRRPAWLCVPWVRRHDVLPLQVRPAQWQRRPVAALHARPVEWERQPVVTQAGVRPLEWQRRTSAQRPPSRAAAFVSAVWGAIARPDPIAAVLPIALVLLLMLIAAFGGRSHLAGRASRTGGSFAGQSVLRVFASSQDGAIYVLDARTGALVWRYQTGAQVESAPAVSGGVVYVGSDDHSIYALRPATKTVLWRFTTSGPVASALTVAGGTVYAGSYDGALYAVRASDGRLLWRYQTGNWISAQPAVAGGVVYVGSYDDDVYALRAADGTLLWRYHTRGMVASSPTIAGASVYVGSADDDIYALSARSGALLWRTATGGSVYSSPALVNGTLYVGSADTYVYALRAADGALLWRTATSGLVFSSPAVANGSVYIGSSDGFLYALRAAGGTVVWRYRTRAAVVAPPAVAHGIVYAGSADGSIYALSAGAGTLVWSYPTGGRVTRRVGLGT